MGMIYLVMDGVIILLILGLIWVKVKKNSYVSELEETVKIKKLQLSAKLIDEQLNGQSSMEQFVQQVNEAKKASQDKQDENEKTPIGYGRSNKTSA